MTTESVDTVRCARQHCPMPVHAKGLCDTHYRQLRAAKKRAKGWLNPDPASPWTQTDGRTQSDGRDAL